MRRSSRRRTTISRRMRGKSANHSTAKRTRPKTSAFEERREPKTTEAKMAALIDRAEGKLGTHKCMSRI